MKVNLKIPYPPSINSYYGTNKYGNKFLQKNVVNHRDKSIILIRHQIKQIEEEFPIRKEVCVWIELYPPDNRCRDIDNVQKSIFDSMQCAGVIENDRLIKEQHVKMFEKQCQWGEANIFIKDLNSQEWFKSHFI